MIDCEMTQEELDRSEAQITELLADFAKEDLKPEEYWRKAGVMAFGLLGLTGNKRGSLRILQAAMERDDALGIGYAAQ